MSSRHIGCVLAFGKYHMCHAAMLQNIRSQLNFFRADSAANDGIKQQGHAAGSDESADQVADSTSVKPFIA